MSLHPDISAIPIVGGNLALDLANTTSERHSGSPRERLTQFDDVVTWAERVELAGRREAAALRKTAAAHPVLAARALDELKELREVIYRIFSAVTDQATPAPADLEALDRAWHDAAQRRQLAWQDGRGAWKWMSKPEDLTRIGWPVVDSAVALLGADELARVKKCRAEDCNWLFVDSSRNRSRRWCDMADCGNRAKVRRYYRRRRNG